MFTILKMTIGCLVFISSTAHAGWLSEDVDLKKIPKTVLENGAFTSSPAPMLQAVAFSDKVILLNVVNSSVVEEKHNLIKSFANTQANANGDDKNASSKLAKRPLKKPGEDHALPSDLEPYGTSTTTLGGLFTLGVVDNETTGQTIKIKAESIAIKDINEVAGSLFPLEVGNSLSFSYVFLNESEKSGVTFVVKTKTPAKLFSKEYADMQDLGLIGDIYVISREIKSAGNNALSGLCDLYYSDELSYVIGSSCADKRSWVKSFKLNKLGESYREEIAAANKASEQEEIDAKIQISAQLSPEMKMKAKEKFSQAFHLFQEGEFEAAVIRFNQALEIDPANGLGHYFLAETYVRLNDTENAMEHYRYTVLFSPDIKEAAIAEVKLSKMKDAINKAPN